MELRSGNIYNNDFDVEQHYQYYSSLGRNFNTWKAHVNRLCKREVNLGCDDLPDMDYYNYFAEGVTFQRMTNILLREVYYCIIE